MLIKEVTESMMLVRTEWRRMILVPDPKIVYRKSIANPKISQLGANLHVYNDHSLLG